MYTKKNTSHLVRQNCDSSFSLLDLFDFIFDNCQMKFKIKYFSIRELNPRSLPRQTITMSTTPNCLVRVKGVNFCV